MLEKRIVRSLLCLAVLLSFSATGVMGANILFISSLDPTHMPGDDALKAFIEGLGHTVTYFDDGENEATTEAAAVAADLVFISESVGSAQVANEITEIEKPMVITESYIWDEMGLTTSGGGAVYFTNTNIQIVNPDHFLAAGLSGTVSVLTGLMGRGAARFANGIAGGEATVIAQATSGGQTYDVIMVYDKGAVLARAPGDGSAQVAADIRVCLGFDEQSYLVWNENAYAMLGAAVNYALGLVTPPGSAEKPYPADAATDVPRDVTLSWTPGEFADKHDVYFGTLFEDVNNASRTNPLGVLASQNQDPNKYDPAGVLDFGQTYYWRVDEVNEAETPSTWQGDVWSFTTELFTYPIENITATASSIHQANTGPEKTIDGSGLDADDLHSREATDMWLSGSEPTGAWIKYEFDKVYKLHQMWVWNSNQMVESFVGFGFKDVTIEYSTNGTDWTTLGTTHEFARAPGADGYAHNTTIDFGGAVAKHVRLTAHSNWGFLPQYGLSEVRFLYIPVRAREPSPGSGATNVDVDVVLSWVAGRETVTHDVYFSADEQAVIDGTAPVATVTKNSYGPLSLDLSMTYYWKINEVNMAETPTTWESEVWNFTTRQFLVVDDFESYNDLDTTDPESNRIFNTWIDGYGVPTNGSIVGYENPPFCEQSIVHSGKQSMPLAYSNTEGAAYSEAERTFAVGQNWTKAGSQILVLFFYGTAGNTGQLYAKINGSKVVYGGDAGDIAKVQWQQWNIALPSLGVNLQNVTKLSIGIDGNGASGKLYFDDIRLYLSQEAALQAP